MFLLTTKLIMSDRTRSPISGEISEPNCWSVVKNLFNLLNCLDEQVGGCCRPEKRKCQFNK